jgi:4-hydroxythreonine-4-phosphate dehydrogenase
MSKIRIGISIGDINGIGLEVILKTLNDPRILEYCVPVIYGSSKIVSYHKNIVGNLDFPYQNIRPSERFSTDKINVVNCWNDNVSISLGKISETGGKYAMQSLEAAVNDLQYGNIDALVTAPINKKAMNMAGFGHIGHTEYLSHSCNNSPYLMLMVGDSMRVGLVTEHMPITQVPSMITKERITEKIKLLHRTLVVDFAIERPTIAVLGLNPHAGDEGLIGTEDEQIVRPAIVELKKSGMLVMGPFPADGFFGSGKFNKFDGILAMYHDQGLTPFKALTFSSGVNYSAGLPIIRTSPDHGTAYDIAGKNLADPESFRKALFLAIDVARNRKEYYELKSNAVERVQLEADDENATKDYLPEED